MEYESILPDGFEATPSEDTTVENTTDTQEINETTENTNEVVENNTEVQEQTEQAKEEARKLRVKYNHQEMELAEDEAIPLIQKGMNYDKLQEQLNGFKNDPRLSFVEQLAKENNMTVNEYLEAVEKARYEEEINKLVSQNIPKEYAEEMLENRKFRLQQLEEKRKAEESATQKAKETQEFESLLNAFQMVNGREYTPNDSIDQNVFVEAKEKGLTLREAYLEHSLKTMQNELKVLKQNQENRKKAPVGSTTAHGSKESMVEDDFLRGFSSI